MNTSFTDLVKKLMDAQVVTKAEMLQTMHENNADLREQFAHYQKEVRAQTRWLIGLGITIILGIAAILAKLHGI